MDMNYDKKEHSFLAMLDLDDGTVLAFSKIANDGVSVEAHNELCANTMEKDSLKVFFSAGDNDSYLLLFKGDFHHQDPSSEGRLYSDGHVFNVGSGDDWFYFEDSPHWDTKENERATESSEKVVPAPDSLEKPVPDSLEKPAPVYIGVNAQGWVTGTKNRGMAYIAQISGRQGEAFSIDKDEQRVYLRSDRSKNFMQTYKREDFPGGKWFAYMTDCDGKDALLKLTIIERYNADGSVKRYSVSEAFADNGGYKGLHSDLRRKNL
ncbi:Uncharacterized protein ALO50_00060 [Pseudomonas syringae pv. cerasicola]|uniref:Uncharacterized protein n=3 Tax=Pseudomonas TaxID=286 RepID=A0A0P9MVW2_PSESX|nr:Uncharacterized protein ALO50_00060 [Pseudomonas syringae pv. cerasicola]RMS82594.1 hypothetical protein ALP60_01904 [Pseudomonas savastanoi]